MLHEREVGMPGVILLLHPIHEAIPVEAAQEALPDPAVVVPVKIAPAQFSLAEMPAVNWGDVQAAQQRLAEGELPRLLKEHPDYRLAYFGLAPVPLAMHLGFIVQRWRKADVHQRNHESHKWNWAAPEPDRPALKAVVRGEPQDSVLSPDDVVVRVSVTARVERSHTAKVVPAAGTEIDLESSALGEDVIRTSADCDALAATFRSLMDRVAAMRPNARVVHVFASVPTGLAFQLGTMLNATCHPRVQTYQYSRSDDPPHRRAILLGRSAARVASLTDEDRAGAAMAREQWDSNLERMRECLAAPTGTVSWFDRVLPEAAPFRGDCAWAGLCTFSDTALKASTIDRDNVSVEGGFRYDRPSAKWRFADDLLAAIVRRLGKDEALGQAGRLLLLHEAVHLRSHRLTDATATAIRRFPKVVEEVDYQADVWAILHELAFSSPPGAPLPSPALLVTQIVRTAVETMWAFNDGLDELDELEIRRVNRYLIWYWQWLRLERCTNMSDVAYVLSRKPTIELCGPRIRADGDRIFYELHPTWLVDPELAVLLDDNSVARHGHAGATSIATLLEGLRQRDGSKIMTVLRSVVDQNGDRLYP